MNDNLKNIIKIIKLKLREEPNSIFIGKLNDDIKDKVICDMLDIQIYYEFLIECNGAYCGSIDLWNSDMLLKSQYRVKDFPGGKDNWVCIGQILYEPIAINKIDGNVYRFYQGYESDIKPDCFGCFDDFLTMYVFGNKYADILPNAEDEEWYKFLMKNNLV